jgi:NAD(P)-dependent dehydrogenase (short-subunit alcohol dehydrogenase family)
VIAAKAGIAGFTRALAMELAPRRITVNTIVPGQLAKPEAPHEMPQHPVYRPLLGRGAWPTDTAPLTRFLLGPHARYITGQMINVSGGAFLSVG